MTKIGERTKKKKKDMVPQSSRCLCGGRRREAPTCWQSCQENRQAGGMKAVRQPVRPEQAQGHVHKLGYIDSPRAGYDVDNYAREI